MVLKVSKSVFVSIKFPSFLILKRLQAVTPCVLRYSVIFSSVSCFSILSRIIPLQLFRVLCSVTGWMDGYFVYRRSTLKGHIASNKMYII